MAMYHPGVSMWTGQRNVGCYSCIGQASDSEESKNSQLQMWTFSGVPSRQNMTKIIGTFGMVRKLCLYGVLDML